MSTAANLTIEGEPVSQRDWKAFCKEQGIEYTPQTIGGNVFCHGGGSYEVEITFGEAKSFGKGPPEEASEIRFSTYFMGDTAEVARLTASAWERFGGSLSADPEVKRFFVAPFGSGWDRASKLAK
jgi:hypothetical protein